nr:hypothetical protein [Tanacetum cinerariifolium]
MSDSDESGVTYTDISSPFEELSDIGSPRADDHEHLMLPEMLEDPYVEVTLQALPSPDYIPGPEEPEQAPPSSDYIPGPEHADDEIVVEDQPYAEDASPIAQSPEYVPESDFEAHPEDDDDKEPEEDPVDYLADGGDDSDDEEESSEDDEDDDMDIEANSEEEEHQAPTDSIVVAPIAADQAPSAEETEPFETDESAATPPLHPAYRMTARISILASVPMPSWTDSEVVRLLVISSPPASPLSPWSSPSPQIPFPPLPPILSPPSPAASTSSPPLQLPSASRREDRPEVTLPPQKRLGIALGPRYEREVGYGITDSWDEIVETLQGAPVSIDTELRGYAPSAEETEPFETDETAATPPPHPAYRMTARISIPASVPMPAWTDSEVVRLLVISSPPTSPLSPWSLPPPQIPFPPLPSILSPPSPVLSPAPPSSPILSLGYRVAMIRLRDKAASTSSPPLQLPSASRREDRPEVTLPPQKRLGIALGPRYEVGESLSAAAARPAGGLRADYGFVATVDREIMHDPEREVGYGITDSWDEIVETLQGAPVSTDTELDGYMREFEMRVRQDTDEIYIRLDDEQTKRQLLAGWLNMLFRDRRAHAYTCHLMETEARMSREAWVRATDARDLVHGEVMSLRTTVLGQMSEIRELQAADRRRQTVISELLRIDHRRSTEITELRT